MRAGPGTVLRASGGALALALLLTTVTAGHGEAAQSGQYRYKFPCAPGQTCYYTQGPHVNNALDFQIGDPAGSDIIRAMAQGTLVELRVDQDVCADFGLGKWARVEDIFGYSENYGHLRDFLTAIPGTVLQGSYFQWEGNTGHAENCAIHLHWEPGTGSPTYIDGTYMPALIPITTVTSSNSAVGDTGTQVIDPMRQRYVNGGSWWGIGWTHNAGRGLDAHRDGAGYEQTFLRDAAGSCTDRSGLYVSDNRPWAAYWVDNCLWDTWNGPASNYPTSGRAATGYPRTDASPADCPGALQGCERFQAFYHGFVWRNSSGQVWSVAAPDVNADRTVDFVGDVIFVAKAALRHSSTYEAGCDVGANGIDDFVGDTIQTAKIALRYNPGTPHQSWVPGSITCTPS